MLPSEAMIHISSIGQLKDLINVQATKEISKTKFKGWLRKESCQNVMSKCSRSRYRVAAFETLLRKRRVKAQRTIKVCTSERRDHR